MRGRRSRVARRLGLGIATATVAVGAATALAETGDVEQKPLPAGCVTLGEVSGCTDGGFAGGGVNTVAASRDGRNLYVAGASRVGVLDRDPDSGTLTANAVPNGCISDDGDGGECVDGKALQNAGDVAVSDDGLSVYVTANTDDAVAVFDRDPATGALTQKPGIAGCVSETGRSDAGDPLTAGECADGIGLDGASGVEVTPDGDNVYTIANTGDAIAVFDRAADGSLQQKQGAAACLGPAAPCTVTENLDLPIDLAVSSDSRNLYVVTLNSDSLLAFAISSADGTLAQLDGCVDDDGDAPCVDGRGLAQAEAITVAPDGRQVYAVSRSDFLTVFDRNSASGALTQKAGTAGCLNDETPPLQGCGSARVLDSPSAVTVSRDGLSVYTAAQGFADPTQVVGRGFSVFRRSLADGTLAQPAEPLGCITTDGLADENDPSTAGQCLDGSGPDGIFDGAHTVALSSDDASLYAGGNLGGNHGIAVFDRSAEQCAGRRVTLMGTQVDDTITGTPEIDVIAGLAGRDEIEGAAGDDVICGSTESDRLGGGTGIDLLYGDTGKDKLTGMGGNDLLTGGDDNDRLGGGGGKDKLRGERGRDILKGGGARDKLDGGPQRDVCKGGGGRDKARSCQKKRSIP